MSILKYKNIFSAKFQTLNWFEEAFVIKKVERSVIWYVKGEKIGGKFYDNELK